MVYINVNSFDSNIAHVKMDGGIKVIETARMTEYTLDGERHRVGGPAYIFRYPSGAVRRKEWYQNGVMTRKYDKPAEIDYGEDGRITSRIWVINGEMGRENDNPSRISVVNPIPISSLDGIRRCMLGDRTVTYKEWRKKGKLHREKGAAQIWIDSNFKIIRKVYWVDGVQISSYDHARISSLQQNNIAMEILGEHFGAAPVPLALEIPFEKE